MFRFIEVIKQLLYALPVPLIRKTKYALKTKRLDEWHATYVATYKVNKIENDYSARSSCRLTHTLEH